MSGEYESFLADVAEAVAQHVAPWRARIAEAIAQWSAAGYQVAVLERAMQLPNEPDVDGLLSTFAAAAEHLAELERVATAAEPALAGDPVFRDPARTAEAEDVVARALAAVAPPPPPDGALAREGFEVGESNAAAARAADEAVAEPGVRHPLLVLHGASGVGKTHLAHAIANDLVNASGGALVAACVTGESFAAELVAAVQADGVERWRARYRAVDALVIDDAQGVAGKERTQAELVSLVDELRAARKQVVVTLDRAPAAVESFGAELRRRLEAATAAALDAPDRALRERLFARALSPWHAALDPALLGFLAERPVKSARDVATLAARLTAAAEVANVPLTLRLAQTELGSAVRAPQGPAGGVVEAFFADTEKVIWDWPDVAARVSEELR